MLHDVPSVAYGGIDGTTIPHQTYMVFQMMFAIITPALIVAAVAERMKFSAFIIFIVIWATFVYDFAAHWTWEITGPDNYGQNPDIVALDGQDVWDRLTLQAERSSTSPLVGPAL